jgi:hypothetical protein
VGSFQGVGAVISRFTNGRENGCEIQSSIQGFEIPPLSVKDPLAIIISHVDIVDMGCKG